MDLDHGGGWTVGPGDSYQVGPNDRHTFEALEDEHHLSILCPALRGDERHDADGAYAPSGPVPAGPAGYQGARLVNPAPVSRAAIRPC